MKKVHLLIFLVISLFFICSCKKDYTCECTNTSGESTSISTSTVHGTKRKAIKSCEKTRTFGGVTTVCVIK